MSLVHEGNYEAAASWLSEQFHTMTSSEELRRFMEETALANYRNATWSSRFITGRTGELEGAVETWDGGTVPVMMSFVKEDTGWKILSIKTDIMEKVIYDCASIKARIVEKDEHDNKDLRIILNFGHTLGHAIEAAAGYADSYNHGESIAIGMLLAGEIALELGMFSDRESTALEQMIRSSGLPVRLKGLSFKKIMNIFLEAKNER